MPFIDFSNLKASDESYYGNLKGNTDNVFTDAKKNTEGMTSAKEYSTSKRGETVHEAAVAYNMSPDRREVPAAETNEKKHLVTIDEREELPDDRRTELIDGVLYDMYSPTFGHQDIICLIRNQLVDCIKKSGKKCRAGTAPFDVVLSENPDTVLQPDVYVLCDMEKLHYKGKKGIFSNKYYGAPELCIEILSPSTRKRDAGIKYLKYLDAGVKEYWLVDLDHEKVIVYDFASLRGESSSDDGLREDVADEVNAVDADARKVSLDRDIIHLYTFDQKVPVIISDGKCEIDFSVIKEELSYGLD